MKVTIIDPKQEEKSLRMEDLLPGTLFKVYTKRDGLYIRLTVNDETGNKNKVIRLNGTPPYAKSIANSHFRNEPVTIIKTVELSTG
jgi:hypothetical protein